MNPHLAQLHPYPFEKLAKLFSGIAPPANLQPIVLSIGEPKHIAPEFVAKEITDKISGLSIYPTIAGVAELRQTIANWLVNRFGLKATSLDIEQHILPVNGTREALFAFAQCVIDPSNPAYVVMPNPFYQIYEGAALLAGANCWYINTTSDTAFLPDFDSVPTEIWKQCQLVYICTPGNPTGTVLNLKHFKHLLELSEQYGFIIASDECYSEIYLDEENPPMGLLQACALLGINDFRNCMVFHSLSKRSSLPGLRSGFVAGDAKLIKQFRLYRTYHGCSMSPPYQAASIKAWSDEEHVKENRKLYRQKFDAVLDILQPVMNVHRPSGSFYLWPETPIDDTEFAKKLLASYNLTVLPGSYLSRTASSIDPGKNRVRIALVSSVSECVEAANRLKDFLSAI